jgi:hypothetical protein
MDGIWCEDVDWIKLIMDKKNRHTPVDIHLILQVSQKAGNLLISRMTI